MTETPNRTKTKAPKWACCQITNYLAIFPFTKLVFNPHVLETPYTNTPGTMAKDRLSSSPNFKQEAASSNGSGLENFWTRLSSNHHIKN